VVDERKTPSDHGREKTRILQKLPPEGEVTNLSWAEQRKLAAVASLLRSLDRDD
jgi:hypothetical protein